MATLEAHSKLSFLVKFLLICQNICCESWYAKLGIVPALLSQDAVLKQKYLFDV